ncbi:xanthine dehydrogenase family protein molybdopterin-binding subunit [Streptomyces syringium]|uniref:CO/xanthine dehydrogenase Mo-binding subunit n=1 Tax=Streptomyces syringium TaxID=76729 RepID=A0ABS4YDL2_9ACTN|nr:molybdopterin cofactor-binding domain-containing protein [Streptomyces syringium]MBP2406889.1 CO/xanthine dehydrogenase Mo-binding subunit [Streptomyces syringium]
MAEPPADARLRKVTGAKVFASDYRPRDLAAEGWPADCAHALLLRSSHVDRPYLRLDLGLLPAELRPDRLVRAQDLPSPPYRNEISAESVQALLPEGEVADYLGQPVAIALYGDFVRFRRAAQELREDAGPLVYGPPQATGPAPTPAQELEDWTRLRATGAQRQAHYLLDTTVPQGYSHWNRGRISRFDGISFIRGGEPDLEADELFKALDAEPADPTETQLVTTTFTQQTDPAFLEPESGLGWLDRTTKTLHLLLGTQSPHGDVPDLRRLLGGGNPAVTSIRLTTTDSGGGFGGRDKSPFAFYLALAAVFSPGPVRLAYDRREQFQGGLKRHGSAVRSWVRTGPDGRLRAMRSFIVLRGGVEANLNGAVLGLAALHATGPYRVPRASVHGVVLERAIPAVGSMRGFGIPQVAFNLETALDRLAVLRLGQDPIAFRLANVLRPGTGPGGDVDLAGTPLRFHVANAEICAAALEHPLWRTRNDPRPADGTLYGVGFACCMEAFGTSQDSVYSAVHLTDDGHVEVWGQNVDMGQGARRSLEHAARELLGAPVDVRLGVVGPFERFEKQVEALGKHGPAGIKLGHGASSASKTAFFHVHVLRETCRALLRLRLVPAARTLLGLPGLAADVLLAAWRDGAFHLPGHAPVPLAALVAELRRTGQATYAIAHGYFCNGWSSATFRTDGPGHAMDIDALGFATSPQGQVVLQDYAEPLRPPPDKGPGKATVPRSLYAAAGHLVGVEISPRQGTLRVVDAVTFLDAGDPLLPSVIEGQVEGGLAMGISHTLFEELPEEAGTGPFVNFDRYRLPRYADITAIRRETVLVPLPPDGVLAGSGPVLRHKGIGEATMTTVSPAIANAVAHALGHTGDRCWPATTPIRVADLPLPAGRP